MSSVVKHEPPPEKSSDSVPVRRTVMNVVANRAPGILDDILERIELGHNKYGTYLMTNNGRNAIMDAYQELLDAIQYLAQAYMETDKYDILDMLETITTLSGVMKSIIMEQGATHDQLRVGLLVSLSPTVEEKLVQLAVETRMNANELLELFINYASIVQSPSGDDGVSISFNKRVR